MAAVNRECRLLAVGQFSTVYAAGLYARFSAKAAGRHFPQPVIQERRLP